MKLLLVRHAEAVPRGTPGIPDDARPLTPSGERSFREAALGLACLVPRPDALLASPLPRARRTAEICAETWGKIEPRHVRALAERSIPAQLGVLRPFPVDAAVALVGHEPHLSHLLATLIRSPDADRLTFRKGGAALLDIAGPVGEGGTLLWFLPPEILGRLAGQGADRDPSAS
ncbi:MAG: histidine phosphatase family protein [Planctomycetes bacterium]|nr:histidine phosphatase family protein [Planctomycetota bacterium]